MADDRRAVEDELVDFEKQELLSSIPLLNRLLLRMEIAPQIAAPAVSGEREVDAGQVPACFAGRLAVSRRYLILSANGAASAFARPGIDSRRCSAWPTCFKKRSSDFRNLRRACPAALDLMVSGLRGGHSLISVIGLVAREAPDPIGPEFRICFDEQNYGLELRTALENLADRVPIQDVRMIMTAILIQKETGGNLAEVLDKCAHVIRERFRLKQRDPVEKPRKDG